MLRILLLFFSTLVISLTVQAREKATIEDPNDSRYSEFVARTPSNKGYSTACDSNGFILATRKLSLDIGTRVLLFSDSEDVNTTINKFKSKRSNATTKAKRQRFSHRIRSLNKAKNRCAEPDGGDDNGSENFRHPGPNENGIGSNLDHTDYFTPEIKFCDMMKHSRAFVPVTNDVFGSGNLQLRSDGYPSFLPQNSGTTTATTVFGLNAQGEEMPAGTYQFSFQGQGTIILSGDGLTAGEQMFSNPGSYQIAYQPSRNGVWLSFIESNSADPINNVKFIMPGYSDTCESNPFYQPFIDFIKNFPVARVMNMMQINGEEYPCDDSTQSVTSTNCRRSWSTRTTTDYQTQGGNRGTAIEYLIQLANAADVDLWITIPHAATDGYMQNAAQLICNGLQSDLRLYLEYSNEVWNSSNEFPQSTWAENMETSLGLSQSGDPVAGQRYYTNRAIRAFEIFEGICGASRVVNVLGGWIASEQMNRLNLQDFDDASRNPNGVRPEALAVAYYMGVWLVDYAERTGQASTISATNILNLLDQNIEQDLAIDNGTEESMVSTLTPNVALANQYSIPLIAYEGGQHLVASNFENSAQIGSTVVEANRSSGIYDVYRKMYQSWFNNGANLFIQFTGVSEFTNTSGAFGLKESFDQDLATAHKFRATLDSQP